MTGEKTRVTAAEIDYEGTHQKYGLSMNNVALTATQGRIQTRTWAAVRCRMVDSVVAVDSGPGGGGGVMGVFLTGMGLLIVINNSLRSVLIGQIQARRWMWRWRVIQRVSRRCWQRVIIL